MANLTLAATTRTVLGKQVKRLRQAGMVPANIYGHNRQSEAVQIPQRQLEQVAREAGSSGMVELHVDGEQGVRNVIIRRLTYNAITRRPVHADLYHVRMDEPIVAEVPIHLTGEAPAVRDENGNVLALLSHVRVRALPGDMPAMITVDISGLAHVDDAIAVRDLALPPGVESMLDPDELVTKVNAPRVVAEETPAEVVPEAVPPAEE
ncbi:MAG: 50S ribosomal protein L25 [Chloroflexota bacterium]